MGIEAMNISLCMIVKDEEDTLDRCLGSTRNFVDEIIVVDTGSSDNTKSIARKYTDKIYDYEWKDNFSEARNYSFSMATMDYIMWLDADDIIGDTEIEKIIDLKRTLDPKIDAVLMKYVLGIDEYNRVTHAFYRERIVKRSKKFRWVGAVHEFIEIEGNLLQTDIRIVHSSSQNESDRNLKILEKIINNGSSPTSREIYYYALELHNNGQHEKAFEYFLKFLNLDYPNPVYIPDACLHAARYYMQENNSDAALKSLIRSMEYGVMKPEILCHIGNLYKELGDYQKAISWYELIFQILIPNFDLEIHSYDLGGFIPCIDLCYCYFQLGEYQEAVKYNNRAAKYKPNDPIIEYNRNLFREAGIM
ncbi:MAG: glycosyltransferase [Syntrophomonadaceae bacterium]